MRDARVPGAGDRDLPWSGAGPFRRLETTEMLDVAPFVLSSASGRYREPAALPLAPEGRGESSVALYFVGTYLEGSRAEGAERDGIYRSRADDARSFYGAPLDSGRTPPRVLAPTEPWEGARLSGPSALRVGTEIWLYYASDGGVGLARSSDGLTFVKESAPVFIDAPLPRGPSVARLPDGTFCMMYGSGRDIVEAVSADGLRWAKRGVVLSPSVAGDAAASRPGEKPPFDTERVADPVIALRATPAGRLHVRVLYTGYAEDGASAIGFAARYGAEGALSKNPAPVYAVGRHEAAPALFHWADAAMLFVQQDVPVSRNETPYTAIAAALAPATDVLGTPEVRPGAVTASVDHGAARPRRRAAGRTWIIQG